MIEAAKLARAVSAPLSAYAQVAGLSSQLQSAIIRKRAYTRDIQINEALNTSTDLPRSNKVKC